MLAAINYRGNLEAPNEKAIMRILSSHQTLLPLLLPLIAVGRVWPCETMVGWFGMWPTINIDQSRSNMIYIFSCPVLCEHSRVKVRRGNFGYFNF